jgi:hypothetical protein
VDLLNREQIHKYLMSLEPNTGTDLVAVRVIDSSNTLVERQLRFGDIEISEVLLFTCRTLHPFPSHPNILPNPLTKSNVNRKPRPKEKKYKEKWGISINSSEMIGSRAERSRPLRCKSKKF